MEYTCMGKHKEGNASHKVLLIENNRTDQISFKKMMEQNGLNYTYRIAVSADEARKALAAESFDIIIADYMLGGGNAFNVPGISEGIPVIIMTGAGNEELAVKAMTEGASDYVIKDAGGGYLKLLPIIMENAIKRSQSQKQLCMLYHAMMSISESVYITDLENRILFVNKAFKDTYRYPEDEIIGSGSGILEKCFYGREHDRGIFDDAAGSRNDRIQVRKDGSEFPARISGSYVKDEAGSNIAIVGVVRDISEIKDAQEKLRVYATTDILTGVLNRRAGLLILEKQLYLAERNNFVITLCYIDIDSLKDINDKYGHQEGDDCIKIIMDIFKEALRESDTICRLGGDEFLIILPDCDIVRSEALWNRMEQRLAEYNQSGRKPYELSVGRGTVQVSPGTDISIDELIAAADEEMYKNKRMRLAR